jgi:hypothetical protein
MCFVEAFKTQQGGDRVQVGGDVWLAFRVSAWQWWKMGEKGDGVGEGAQVSTGCCLCSALFGDQDVVHFVEALVGWWWWWQCVAGIQGECLATEGGRERCGRNGGRESLLDVHSPV